MKVEDLRAQLLESLKQLQEQVLRVQGAIAACNTLLQPEPIQPEPEKKEESK